MTTSQEGASSTTEAPPPPPPPPIETSFDLWDPFGNPAELRAAADAWDAMGAHLSEMRSNLNGVVTASAGGWSGGAHDAFVAHWNAMAPELGEGGEGMREVASHLRTMADELEAKNDLVQSIYVTVAATAAVSIISGLVTFGVGAAAGAAATAVNVARAERALVAIRAFIVASRATMATIKATRVGAFALRFAAFAARGVIETAAVKQVALDQNPLDADSWSAFDVLFIGGGGLISAAPARIGANTGRRLTAGRGVAQTAAKLPAKSTIRRAGYEFATDQSGRVTRASGALKLGKGTRDNAAAATARSWGNTGDHAGHLIARRFDGPGDIVNLLPQNANLNLSAWKTMENQWASALKNGQKVSVEIRPNYMGRSLRPSSFDVTYMIDGVAKTRLFQNL